MPEVIEVLIHVLQSVKNEAEDRWRKLSRAVTDAILPLLAAQKIKLDSKVEIDVYTLLSQPLSVH